MFDKKGFVAFVGSVSGANYSNGLEHIEKVYSVDIDEEIARDQAASLLVVIDEDKKKGSGNDRKNRQNWYSHLKKYVEYIEGLPAEKQKQRFVSWLKKQPQRNNPSKTYSDITVNATVYKLQSGLKTLGVSGYEHVNCFAIVDVDTFCKLHQACYAAATESDMELGHSDFRNGLDFYLQFLTEVSTDSAENEMLKKIRFIIAHYKANFATVNKQERYKWQALHWYKQHWKLEADDFAQMVENAFAKTSNLLASGMYYPYRMITKFAQSDPEAVRKIFRTLFDEQLPLEERYQTFRKGCQVWVDQLRRNSSEPEKTLNHYQDLRAVMVYLTFQYPEKYYLFKSAMYSTFRDRIGFKELQSTQKTGIQKIENYTRMCEVILDEVRKDTELLSMHKNRLDHTCYQDEALHLLTMDIVFYGSNYMSEDLFSIGDHYWPASEEYDPGITKEMWTLLLQDPSVTSAEALKLLSMFLKLGGESSFLNLGAHFGNPFDYKETLDNFSTRVMDKVNCAKCPKEYREFLKYIIPFVGRMAMDGDVKRDSWKLRDELYAALKEIDLSAVSLSVTGEEETMDTKTDVGLNTILYGPPGTGKTYHTAIYAVAIIENKELDTVKAEKYQDVVDRYNAYKAQGRIEFTTFHQSYGYEEFIEGIRPAVVDEGDDAGSGNIQYSVQPGMFKKFCEKADRPVAGNTIRGDLGIGENATVWKVSLWGTGDNEVRTECLESGHIRIGWDQYGKDITDETDFSAGGGRVVLNAFMNKMQIGDIIFSCYSASTIDAIGVVTGEYEWHDEYDEVKRVRKVNWIVKGIRENILELNGGTSMTLASVYRLSNIAIADVYKLIEKYQPAQTLVSTQKENYVFIIDEINRGNISKIFGELITLIEGTKRVGKSEGMKTLLPYSMKPFGVPDNVYIIGTMNTADRSIAAIDTALRRRFEFKEMLPDPEVLKGISVEKLSIKEIMTRMNRRIAVLYDREHTIGHAYFMPLKYDNSMEQLADIFKNKVIPLLQEYFYEDYEKIRLVLGDNQKKDERNQFVLAKKINQADLFGNADIGLDDGFAYEINEDAFMNPEAYRLI